jgi:hypothetical protein
MPAARGLVGQPWSAPVHVSGTTSEDALDPRVAIDGSGRALVAWDSPKGKAIWTAWFR